MYNFFFKSFCRMSAIVLQRLHILTFPGVKIYIKIFFYVRPTKQYPHSSVCRVDCIWLLIQGLLYRYIKRGQIFVRFCSQLCLHNSFENSEFTTRNHFSKMHCFCKKNHSNSQWFYHMDSQRFYLPVSQKFSGNPNTPQILPTHQNQKQC